MTAVGASTTTPYGLVAEVEPVVEATKGELVAVSRRIEREALLAPPPAVAATLQDARYLTPRTREVYARLAAAGAPARLFARELQSWIAPGVTGVALDDDDPLVDEWVVVVPGDRPVVFAATDLRVPDCDDDLARCFSYAVSRDPALVRACAQALGLDPA
ncbi:MAG TPA: DICT sensory domain-containing protein [Mycobacteriales bacterium]|nr:DICT sensory domain-containing protein [Mycobacteriales bacterium]